MLRTFLSFVNSSKKILFIRLAKREGREGDSNSDGRDSVDGESTPTPLVLVLADLNYSLVNIGDVCREECRRREGLKDEPTEKISYT